MSDITTIQIESYARREIRGILHRALVNTMAKLTDDGSNLNYETLKRAMDTLVSRLGFAPGLLCIMDTEVTYTAKDVLGYNHTSRVSYVRIGCTVDNRNISTVDELIKAIKEDR